MSETTLEEARRCPKCNEPGHDTGNTTNRLHGATRGAIIHEYKCMNQRCKWYDTSYLVQTNPDGTIPPPTLVREKAFRQLPAREQEDIDRQMNNLLNQQLGP